MASTHTIRVPGSGNFWNKLGNIPICTSTLGIYNSLKACSGVLGTGLAVIEKGVGVASFPLTSVCNRLETAFPKTANLVNTAACECLDILEEHVPAFDKPLHEKYVAKWFKGKSLIHPLLYQILHCLGFNTEEVQIWKKGDIRRYLVPLDTSANLVNTAACECLDILEEHAPALDKPLHEKYVAKWFKSRSLIRRLMSRILHCLGFNTEEVQIWKKGDIRRYLVPLDTSGECSHNKRAGLSLKYNMQNSGSSLLIDKCDTVGDLPAVHGTALIPTLGMISYRFNWTEKRSIAAFQSYRPAGQPLYTPCNYVSKIDHIE